ncbi:MAG: glycosyl hydrolase 53 family protein, partial [Rhodothermales bacterium]|nr:glycosyl hydrolase 53 family protein [Rhodothermales bacterium]
MTKTRAAYSLPLLLSILVGLTVWSSCRIPSEVPDASKEFMIGADLSMLARVEQLGGVYRDGGVPRDGLEIFRSRGYNWIRLRIFHSPNGRGGTVNDLGYTLALAKRA